MSLQQDNINIAAVLNNASTMHVLLVIRLLEGNTETRIRLHNAVKYGASVDFDLVSGFMTDVDKVCKYNDVSCNKNTLQVLK